MIPLGFVHTECGDIRQAGEHKTHCCECECECSQQANNTKKHEKDFPPNLSANMIDIMCELILLLSKPNYWPLWICYLTEEETQTENRNQADVLASVGFISQRACVCVRMNTRVKKNAHRTGHSWPIAGFCGIVHVSIAVPDFSAKFLLQVLLWFGIF